MVSSPNNPEYPPIFFSTTSAVVPKSPRVAPINEPIRSPENVVCSVMQNLYISTGTFVNKLTAIKPFNTFRQVL